MNMPEVDLLNLEALPEALLLITTLAGSALTAIARIQRKLRENTVQYIGRAEEKFADHENAGGTKHDYVVDKLYTQIPAVLRPFFAKKRLSGLVEGTFESVNRFSELRSAYYCDTAAQDSLLPEAAQTNEAEASDMRNSAAVDIDYTIPFKEGGDKDNATKINSANQPMSGDSFLQNNGIQGAVRVFTLRGGHGFFFRAEYRVCKRNRHRNRGRHG